MTGFDGRARARSPTAVSLRRRRVPVLALLAALVGGATFTSGNAVSADSSPPASPAPTGVTPEKFDAAVEELLEQQAPLLRERWAGTQWQPDGTVVVGLTPGDVPGALAGHPKIRVVTQRFTTGRLDAAIETVTERLNPLLAPGMAPGSAGKWPYEAHVDAAENVVIIDLDPSQSDKRAAVDAALADELAAGTVRIVSKETPHNEPACASRTNCSQPFRGGTRVYGVNWPYTNCTLNFPVKDWAGVRYQATASHCAGTPWRHGGRDIGGTAWTEDVGNHDYKVIRNQNENERAPQNMIYRNTQTATPITIKLVTPSNGAGVHVCHEGSYGQGCGIVASTNTTWNGRGGFGRFVSTFTCLGDSGGPIYNSANLRAYGVTTGITTGGAAADCYTGVTTYFTWTVNAENASGYQLLLSDTTEALGPGQVMMGGDLIRSPNGAYVLTMQTDGNLVLYGPTGAVWDTGTWGNPGAIAVMQNVGNLVVYRSDRAVLWARPGSPVGGSRLVMQNDRNVVIYTSIGTATWASGTNI